MDSYKVDNPCQLFTKGKAAQCATVKLQLMPSLFLDFETNPSMLTSRRNAQTAMKQLLFQQEFKAFRLSPSLSIAPAQCICLVCTN